MKKFWIIIVLLLFGCASTEVVRETEGITYIESEEIKGPKRKVAVIDFENKTRYGARRLGEAVSDILITELGKSNRFILVEREKFDKLIEEQELERSRYFAPEQQAEMGMMLGLNAIVTGSVSQFGVHTEGSNCLLWSNKRQVAEATVDVRIVNVETGEMSYTETGSGVAERKYSQVLGIGSTGGYDELLEQKALRQAIVKFVKNLEVQLSRATWYCRVAEYDGETVYLDAGQRSNLPLGTILLIRRPGKEIRSPETGIVIGYTQEELGKIEVTGYFGDDGSFAVVVSGDAPDAGDYAVFLED
ncbi:hypothetical protein KAX02_01260 [candidate division WOR-3 bacterium]|nr:hypothetical protein [candidate division WOR-3 bacterium]